LLFIGTSLAPTVWEIDSVSVDLIESRESFEPWHLVVKVFLYGLPVFLAVFYRIAYQNVGTRISVVGRMFAICH
jgi:hypothetical protein